MRLSGNTKTDFSLRMPRECEQECEGEVCSCCGGCDVCVRAKDALIGTEVKSLLLMRRCSKVGMSASETSLLRPLLLLDHVGWGELAS